MKILIGTPAGGGQVTVQYLLSFLETMNHSSRENGAKMQAAREHNLPVTNKDFLEIGLYTLSNESLLARGRNHIAQVALTGGWDKLFFIDADAGWSWQQFKSIATSSDPITAGICPLKTYPISLNYLPFKADEQYFVDAQRSLEGTKKMAEGHKSPVVSVAFVGTAFLCIDISVLRKMAEHENHYQYPNPYTGFNETHWTFFNEGPISDTYFSEDWAFCHKARELGYEIKINTEVIINHTGSHTFRAG